jgi:hypothetical protein
MAVSSILRGFLYTILLAIILYGCFMALYFLLAIMTMGTDGGIDATVMALELGCAACWLTIVSGALYSIYRWCFVLFSSPGASRQEFFRSSGGSLYVVLFVVAALTTLYFLLSLGLIKLQRPARFWFIPILLKLGWFSESIAVIWAMWYVVLTWYHARSSAQDTIESADKMLPKWVVDDEVRDLL